jgi:hypothetical protein
MGVQPSADEIHESGYFAILNAWSVILSLPLNLQDFVPGPGFFHDAYKLIQAVLQGEADYLLIWAFLHCRQFVGTSQAPDVGRRFARTVPTHEEDVHL